MKHIETDPRSGAEIYQLTDDGRPADNIYGEQPYSPPDGSRVTVRFYKGDGRAGALAILELGEETPRTIIEREPRFPAFHAWSEYLYCQEQVGERLMLRRWHYHTLAREDVIELPASEGRFSYGTVSQDHRYYAVSVHRDNAPSRVLIVDLKDGKWRTLAETKTQQLFKHEQFSRDGRNRVLIQANSKDVTVVNLGVAPVDGEGFEWLPVDTPHTPRCTGHETWIGGTGRVFCSTGYDAEKGTNIWTAALGDAAPVVVRKTPLRFGHVSASCCGRYWIGDTGEKEGVCIYAGAFATGEMRRLLNSRTVYDGKQWSHTHPYLTADNRWLIYTSTRSGLPEVHGARVPDAFFASLEG